jgi:hypothetical protein
MKEGDPVMADETYRVDAAEGAANPLTVPIVVSGLYTTAGAIPGLIDSDEIDVGAPAAPSPAALGEELRLDVDGRYPLMIASGTIPISPVQRLHWIAKLQTAGPHKYTGGIYYKDPASAPFGYTTVDINVTGGPLPASRKAILKFTGAGLPARVRNCAFKSPYYHKVEFEYDAEQPIVAETAIDTGAHPNRPATLPVENLSIEKVYQRSGFDVSISPGASQLPNPVGGTWSDMEMHDAMVSFWSHFANKAQWAMWVLFARRHETGTSLGGIMFDDIGPNHRQGTALFYDSFIANAPAGDPNPAAWVKRMKFWTAVHEMGHAFNLAHSWQKALGTPWVPLVNEPEARSFMNYPYNVTGGQSAFFANFEFGFSKQELLFMRHAPGRFVRMGDADWFDNHGFQQASLHPEPPLSLEIRVNRARASYEFLEPVVVELKLKNISTEPQIVDENVLTTLDGITIAIKRQGSPARQHIPFAHYCMKATPRVLQPGESIYASTYLSAGLKGAAIAEPGRYLVQGALHTPAGDIVSPPLVLRVTPARGYDEELIAQDFYSDEVSRVLAFDGSRVLAEANTVLRTVVDTLGDRRVSKHARVPLGLCVSKEAKVLSLAGTVEDTLRSARQRNGAIEAAPARPQEARSELTTALVDNADVAAESLGHIDYKQYMDSLTDVLEAEGDRQQAANVQDTLYNILAARGVLQSVLKQVEQRRKSLQRAKGA